MAIHTPSYITKNRLGIYLFQIKLPATIRCHISTKKVLFRKSLKTRNRNHALKLARFLAGIMDNLFKKYFNDPESYGKAMQLLESYESASEKAHNFNELEEMFLSGLTEHEDYLLEKAITMDSEDNANKSEENANKQKLEDEIIFLKKALLVKNTSTDVTQNDDETNPLVTDVMKLWVLTS